MLVLNRQKDDAVMIANGVIVVTVLEIRGNKVKLGFDAPPDVPVHRAEVQRLVDAEKFAYVWNLEAPPPTSTRSDSHGQAR